MGLLYLLLTLQFIVVFLTNISLYIIAASKSVPDCCCEDINAGVVLYICWYCDGDLI